uniref:G-protein coupled receptors family 1 profile domain-containing protein n=1 Tax=Ficedula albicollis TaxID=59894 RepID=A0A803VQR3_FICAL
MTHPPYSSAASSSSPAMSQSNQSCSRQDITFKSSLYATTYTLIFIPGLLANGAALWVLCRFLSRKSKAVIFMINLAVADLAHVLSLPLRIYYYINHTWPFGDVLCLLCFYLKYLNMYASICFLTCISIQRYFFLYHPFRAKGWKRRYDAAISALVWLVVGAACVPFPIMRSHGLGANTTSCFADLQVKPIASKVGTVLMTGTAELLGFVGPLVTILFCTWKTRDSIRGFHGPQESSGERRKALRMVSMCAVVFCVCFAPYHIIPGLLANSAALWVLCRFLSRKSKAVIFMINLAVADLAHVLSLPLRIYYYINHTWPFGDVLCLLCFYLKYLNMYASICFLTCISIQRYFFLYHPFRAKGWKRRLHQHPAVPVPAAPVPRQGLEAPLRRGHQRAGVARGGGGLRALPHHEEPRAGGQHHQLLCRPAGEAHRQQGGHGADDGHGRAAGLRGAARHHPVLHVENQRLHPRLPRPAGEQRGEEEGPQDGFHVCRRVLRVFRSLPHQLLLLHVGEGGCHHRLLPEHRHPLHTALLPEPRQLRLLLGSHHLLLHDF